MTLMLIFIFVCSLWSKSQLLMQIYFNTLQIHRKGVNYLYLLFKISLWKDINSWKTSHRQSNSPACQIPSTITCPEWWRCLLLEVESSDAHLRFHFLILCRSVISSMRRAFKKFIVSCVADQNLSSKPSVLSPKCPKYT